MSRLVARAQLPPSVSLALDRNLTAFADCVGTCERILKTPIPLSYTRCGGLPGPAGLQGESRWAPYTRSLLFSLKVGPKVGRPAPWPLTIVQYSSHTYRSAAFETRCPSCVCPALAATRPAL